MCLCLILWSVQVSQSANPASLLRRSSRSKVQQSTVTTGSCVSSAASTQACTSYQIRGPNEGVASSSPSAVASHSGHTSNSGSSRRRRKSATFTTNVGKLHDTSNNQVLVEASTSGMANDGSRDAHNQSQNIYGKASKKISLKLQRMTFTSADSNSSSSTRTNESTDMSNIHSLRRSPRGSVKASNLSTSATVHTSPLAVNASSTAISIATTKYVWRGGRKKGLKFNAHFIYIQFSFDIIVI